jgi:hypothetical protein
MSDFRGGNGAAAKAGCEDAARTPDASLAAHGTTGSSADATASDAFRVAGSG